MKRLILLLAVAAMLLALTANSAETQPLPLASDYWRDPAFVKRFMGSYGVNSEIEPTISIDEKKVFDEISTQVDADPSAAALTLQAALTPESSAALDFTLGNLFFQQGDFGTAAPHYQNALKKFPDFMRAHKNLGMIDFRENRNRKAASAFTRAIELGGEDGGLYGLLGHAYLREGRHLAAESAFRKALLFDPDYEAWLGGLASSLLQQRRYEAAVALFDELILRDTSKGVYWLAQADAYLGLEQPLNAAANYEIVRRMGQATPGSLINLGDVYFNGDLAERGLEAYSTALAKGGNNIAARLFPRLSVVASKGDPAASLSFFQKLREATGAELTAEQELQLLRIESRALIADGQTEKALSSLQQILERDPLDAETLIIVGDYHADSGKVEKAELIFQRASRVEGYEAKAWVRQAQLLVGREKYQEAIPLLQRAQAIQPRASVANYLERLERLVKTSK